MRRSGSGGYGLVPPEGLQERRISHGIFDKKGDRHTEKALRATGLTVKLCSSRTVYMDPLSGQDSLCQGGVAGVEQTQLTRVKF